MILSDCMSDADVIVESIGDDLLVPLVSLVGSIDAFCGLSGLKVHNIVSRHG
jgi:hypothetical protein